MLFSKIHTKYYYIPIVLSLILLVKLMWSTNISDTAQLWNIIHADMQYHFYKGGNPMSQFHIYYALS